MSLPTLPYSRAVRNERLSFAEILLITPFIVVVQQYVPVLATRLGASSVMLGLVTSGSALMLALAAALGTWYMARAPEGVRSLAMPVFMHRTMLVWIPLVLLLPPEAAAMALIALTIGLSFFAGLGQVTFASMLPRFTWSDRLSNLVSWRWTALGAGMAVATPALGAMLDAFPIPANYAVVCALAGLIMLASSVCLFRIQPAPRRAVERKARGARDGLRKLLAHRPARHYLIVTFLANLAINAAAPLITLRLVRELGATDTDVGIWSAIFWASLTAASIFMPPLVRKFGTARVFAASGAALMCQLVVLALAQSIPVTWLSGLFGGLGAVMFQVTQFSLIVESSPADQYEEFVSAQSTVMNLSIFAGPLAMALLVDGGVPVGLGLLACAIGRFLATALVLLKPKQPAPSAKA